MIRGLVVVVVDGVGVFFSVERIVISVEGEGGVGDGREVDGEGGGGREDGGGRVLGKGGSGVGVEGGGDGGEGGG